MQLLQDHQFIEKTLKGDATAYAFLVNRYKQMVFTLAVRIVRNREDAEEVAQDAFLKAYKNLHNFRGTSKFSTWLYRITYTSAVSKARIKTPYMVELTSNDDSAYNFEPISLDYDRLAAADRKKVLDAAISKLPENEALIITLYYHQECNIEEICEVVQMSNSNVKVKLHRARKKLQEELIKSLNGELSAII